MWQPGTPCLNKPFLRPKKVSGFWSPRTSPQTRTLAFLIFFFGGLWNDVPLQPKLLFHSHWSMYVCPICEASLIHHTLYMRHLVAAYTCITYFPVRKKYIKNKYLKKHVTAPILKPTDDQKPETFVGLKYFFIFLYQFGREKLMHKQ